MHLNHNRYPYKIDIRHSHLHHMSILELLRHMKHRRIQCMRYHHQLLLSRQHQNHRNKDHRIVQINAQ